jgi:hypothetical protein
MCVVSMVGDDFSKRIREDEYWKKFITPPHSSPLTAPSQPYQQQPGFSINLGFATAEEVAVLRREVEQLKQLLKRAIKYDEDNNEPHCEIDEKVQAIKVIAKALGVDMNDIFKEEKAKEPNVNYSGQSGL